MSFNVQEIIFLVAIIGGVLKFISWAYEEQIKPVEDKALLNIYIDVESNKHKRIPTFVSEVLERVLRRHFQGVGFSFDSVKSIFVFSFFVSLLMFIHYRLKEVHTINNVIDGFFESEIGLIFCLLFVINLVMALISSKVTYLNIKKAALSNKKHGVLTWVLVDLLIAYLMISVSVYFSASITLPLITYIKTNDIEKAIGLLTLLLSFEHWNALQWIITAPISIGDMKNSNFALISFIPTIIYISIIASSIVVYLIIDVLKVPIMNVSLRYFDSKEKNVTAVFGASLFIVATVLMYFLRAIAP